ncbi:uracil-DNA glycosylase [Solemya velesiana gill symbiont]|uniref:Type-5 uracil-DNA glycosylase n=1 Tax=Solemya velesiana gill symbiont TaxID=1918948 RepID=A0A1T2KP42_9GAMM|nr:uracil-DNA glycosylase [Solemya velesiana gill symbiont]OOZ34627.1 SPO1 DNA polymerase [Solemya velesiana gill symbiont]
MFDSDCTQCSRLADFLVKVKNDYPDYHAAPVAPFGDPDAKVLVVGLAPGMHGANATGRPFTGDYAGILLYETLYRYGFSTAAESISADDGLQLKNCRITNAVKCLPPQNKPVGSEINQCNSLLKAELEALPDKPVIIALGSIAHNAVLKAVGLKQSAFKFGHNQLHELPDGQRLIDSYHCSRYNTQTKRLTPEMFHAVFERAKEII